MEDAKKDIYIHDDKKAKKQTVAFKSKSADLTKEQAIEAIGPQKERFVVETFEQGEWPEDSES